MTISAITILLSVFFLLPSFLMSHNRLRKYIFTLLPSVFTLFLLYFIDLTVKKIDLNTSIGEFFYPMWGWLFQGYKEFTMIERLHLSASFTYLSIYILLLILSSFIVPIFFVGTNPEIHKPIRFVHRLLDIILFLVFSYGVLFVFIAEIRMLLPFPDGFLSPIFNLIYSIKA